MLTHSFTYRTKIDEVDAHSTLLHVLTADRVGSIVSCYHHSRKAEDQVAVSSICDLCNLSQRVHLEQSHFLRDT